MSDPFGPPGGHTPRGDPVPFTTFTGAVRRDPRGLGHPAGTAGAASTRRDVDAGCGPGADPPASTRCVERTPDRTAGCPTPRPGQVGQSRAPSWSRCSCSCWPSAEPATWSRTGTRPTTAPTGCAGAALPRLRRVDVRRTRRHRPALGVRRCPSAASVATSRCGRCTPTTRTPDTPTSATCAGAGWSRSRSVRGTPAPSPPGWCSHPRRPRPERPVPGRLPLPVRLSSSTSQVPPWPTSAGGSADRWLPRYPGWPTRVSQAGIRPSVTAEVPRSRLASRMPLVMAPSA